MKKFHHSKLNWTGVALVGVGLQDFITTLDFSMMGIKDWVTSAIGALVIILRTYFTAGQIGTPPEDKDKLPGT